MKKYNILYNKWGKILQISTAQIKPVKNKFILNKINNTYINDIFMDRASINSFFIYDNKVHKKEGIIYLPKCSSKYIKINHTDNADITLNIIKSKKIIKIKINPNCLSLFYNRKMKDKFKFITQEPLYFLVKLNNKLLKKIEIPIDNFLGTFNTTIDISDLPTMNNIDIYTKPVFNSYSISKIDYIVEDNVFYKVLKNKINCDIEIKLKNPIQICIKKEIYGDITLYSTMEDENYIIDRVTVKNEDIQNISNINVQLMTGTKIYCSNNIYATIKE